MWPTKGCLRPRAADPQGGFSLVEVLLAVMIVALLAGMAVVDYSGLLTFERLKQTARKLGGYCDRARAQAVSRQCSCLLQLDLRHSRYRFLPDPSRDRFGRFINPDTEVPMTPDELEEWDEGFDWEDLPRDVFFVDVLVSANEKFDERHEVVSIRYPSDGTVDPFVIHLKSGPGDLFSVSTMSMGASADCGPGRAEFPVAEASEFSQIMGADAPGKGSEKKGDQKDPKKQDKDPKAGSAAKDKGAGGR
jgi:prepilin-type N-terminal cleavage/methylation domain-containing protein